MTRRIKGFPAEPQSIAGTKALQIIRYQTGYYVAEAAAAAAAAAAMARIRAADADAVRVLLPAQTVAATYLTNNC